TGLDLAVARDAAKRIGEAGRLRLERQLLQDLGRPLRRRRRPGLRAHGIERDGGHQRAAHDGVQEQAFHAPSGYAECGRHGPVLSDGMRRSLPLIILPAALAVLAGMAPHAAPAAPHATPAAPPAAWAGAPGGRVLLDAHNCY